MKITKKNGEYCASQVGVMNRLCVASGLTWAEAALSCGKLLLNQQNENYHNEQSLTWLSEKGEL
jgi:hypothetical protein